MFVMRSDFSVTPLVTSRASLPTSGAFPNSFHLWSIPCRTRVPYPRVSFSQSREVLYSILSFLGLRCLGNLLRAPTQFPRTTDFYPQPLKRGTRSITLIEESGPQPFHVLAVLQSQPKVFPWWEGRVTASIQQPSPTYEVCGPGLVPINVV